MTPRRVEVRDGDHLVFVPTGVSRPLDLGPILINGAEVGLSHRSEYVSCKIQLCSVSPRRTRFDNTFRVFEIELEEQPSPYVLDRIDQLETQLRQALAVRDQAKREAAAAEAKLAKIREAL